MSDSGVRNWRVDCPRLHELCVQLETHFALAENCDRLLADLAGAFNQYAAAKGMDAQRQKELREYCETTLFQNPQLCAKDNQPDDNHRWHVHTYRWHVQNWCKVPDEAEEDRSPESGEQQVEGVRLLISGWVPGELLEATPRFVLPLPPEKADSIGRLLSQAEKAVALAVIHDVVANDPIVAEGSRIEEWPTYWLAVEHARNEAGDSWVPKLEAWARELGVTEQPAGAMIEVTRLLSTVVGFLQGICGKSTPQRTVNDPMRDRISAFRYWLFRQCQCIL